MLICACVSVAAFPAQGRHRQLPQNPKDAHSPKHALPGSPDSLLMHCPRPAGLPELISYGAYTCLTLDDCSFIHWTFKTYGKEKSFLTPVFNHYVDVTRLQMSGGSSQRSCTWNKFLPPTSAVSHEQVTPLLWLETFSRQPEGPHQQCPQHGPRMTWGSPCCLWGPHQPVRLPEWKWINIK